MRSPTLGSQPASHHTIYPDAVAVYGPDTAINNCDRVTFTIVATNDAITTTGVVITSTMPAGFVPTQRIFNVGTVGPNETITRHAVFSATCDAVSGQNIVTLTQDGAAPIVKITDFAVDPGAITVRKEPAVVPAGVGDLVTWTVIVRNSGYGRVDNVVVTDVLGSGLTFVAGQTSAYTPSLAPDSVLTFPVVARVDACVDLGDVVTATWGCPSGQCQQLWAKANVDLRLDVPFLDYSTPPFDVDYCTGSEIFTITVNNSGAGTAHDVLLRADMSPFSVTVLSPGAAYTPGLGFTLPDITGSTDYELVCELTVPDPCGLSAYGGSFDFQLEFEDDCGNPYVLPVRQESWQLVGSVPSLSISKENVPGEIYLGEVVSPVITVDAANLGSLVVTDTLPPGWSVLDADGGSVFTIGTTTYITWLVPGTTTTRLYPVLQSPITDTTGCTYCGTQAVNTVEVRGADCQDCDHAAQATASTYIQCENDLTSRDKQVAPASAETCTGFVYTNTYVFASSFAVTPTWQGMVFTDELPHQTYVPGSAGVWLSNGQSCAAVFSETVVNGMLVLSNISPTCGITVPGATMVVTYRTGITAPAGCDDLRFYDWSYLDLGVTGNSYCADDGVLEEGVFVAVDAPQMAVGVLGAPANVEPCAEYTVTLTLDRLDAAPAYDVAMRFNTTDYAVVEVLGFGGATPAFTTTGPLSYTWFYGDQFATATTATVQLHLQRRCDATGPLSVEAWYEGLCEDDADYFEQCYVSGGANPPPLTPSLIVAKYPELHWAESDRVTWTLTLINAGAGTAHHVLLTDTLGSGLRYVTSTITTTRGSVAGVTPVVSGGRWVTWTLDEVPSGAQVTLGFVAEVVGCEDLTNQFSGYQFCQGQMCRYAGPKTSVVELPETIMLNTNVGLTPIEVCTTGTVTVTVKNAGLMSVYSATITDVLPSGLVYLPGTTEYSTDQVNWQAGPDPSIAGQTLTWGPTSGLGMGDLLRVMSPDETVYIRYRVRADCDYEGGLLRIHAYYYDVCGTPHRTAESTYMMEAQRADLTIVKQGRNVSTGGPLTGLVLAEPGESVLWVITVTNGASAGTAYQVLVTDTLPWNAVFVTATTPVTGPDSSGTLTWSLGTLAPGATAVVTVSTVVSTPEGCDPVDTVNAAAVSWGCPTGCRSPWQTTQALLRTRPVYRTADLRVAPTGVHLCEDVLTITLDNQGTPAYNGVLTATLPAGLVYSETLSISAPADVTPSPGDNPAVWRWTTSALPTGPTTIVIRVRNDAFTGDCLNWSGSVVLDLNYDDVSVCPSTGPYATTRSIPLTRLYPVLQVDKQPTQQTADVGDWITWTITVRNTGSGIAYNVLVTDVVEGNYVGVTATVGSDGAPPTVAGNVITWAPNPIPAGGTWTAYVSAQLIDVGANRNVVTATTYCGTGCVASSGTDTAYLTLLETFRKGPPVQTDTIGALAVFTFTAYMPDTDALYENVVLTDALPIGLGYVGSVLTYTYDGDGSSGGPTTLISSTPTVTPGHLASGDVVWALGDLPGTVQINGVLTAVVQDVPSNYDGLRLTNVLTMAYTDDTRDYVYTDTADVDVVEPILHIGKTYVTSRGCGATILQDNFNDGTLGNWSAINSSVVVEDGRVHLSSSGDMQNTTVLSDFSISLMARKRAGNQGDFWIVFRTTNDWNSYSYIFEWRSTDFRLRRFPGTVSLATVGGAPGAGSWHHFEVRAEGSRIQIYVDGSLIFDVIDDTHASGFTQIRTTEGSDIDVDDILITRFGQAGCLVGANDPVTYTLVVSNQSRIPGYDLVITDALPGGMSLVTYTVASDDPTASVVAGPGVGATGVLTWAVDHLTPTVPFDPVDHTGITLTVVLQVEDGVTANVTFSDQAALAYDNWEAESQPLEIDRDYSGGSHSASVRTVGAGIFKAVAFSPPPTATLGTLVTYTLTVPESPITATLYDAVVTDTVDSRLRIEGVSSAGGTGGSVGWSGQVVTATFASIPHGTQATITVTTRISHEWPSPAGDANAGDVITDMAVLTHREGGPIPSNVVSTTVGEPRVSVSKVGRVLADAWTALYTLTVVNQGDSPAYSLVVTDAVPEGLAVVAVGSGGVLAPDGRIITWTLPFLDVPPPPDNTVVLTFTAQLGEPIYAGRLFTDVVTVRNTSLTETVPGVREYVTDDLNVLTWPLGRLGDYVWYDFDYDGIQGSHPGEFGISGVVVELFDADTGAFITYTTTAADGSYIFEYLPLGVTYTVRISSASYDVGGPLYDYTQTVYMASSATPATDSNGSITQTFGGLGYAITTTLTPAFTEDLTLDYGFVHLVELGNYVWFDENHNGIQDDTTGFGGVTVTLTYPDGRVFTTTTTANGYYTFTVPVSQVYTITVVAANFGPGGPLEGYAHTVPDQGTDDALDSDGRPVGGDLIVTTPVITDNDYTFDFGLVQLVSLGNQVWYDTDDSGTLDAGEVGVPGVAIELYQDTNGDGLFTPGVDQLISTTTTAAGGYYTFTRLYPSLLPTQTYLVVVTQTNFAPGGVLGGYINSTAVYTGDSDLNERDHGIVYGVLGAGGYVASDAVTVTPGDEPINDGDTDANSNLTIDFGFYRLSLGDQVWYDANNDGYLDAGEVGAPGVEVRLYDGTGTTLLMTTTTDASGYYTFTGLVSGTYVVEVIPPPNYASSADTPTTANPDTNVNGDDNGVGTAGGAIRSNPVHLAAGDAGALGNNVVDDGTGSTHNPTVDFGLFLGADLVVVKSDDPDPVVVGTVLTYTFAVTNEGPSVARNVVVTDALPPEVAFLSATPSQSGGPNPLVWTGLGDLGVGESLWFTMTVRVNTTATRVFTNAVTVASDTPDHNLDNNTDEEPTTPLVPGLDLAKTVEPGRVTRNRPLTYTIRITNTGAVTFDPLVLTDTLPPDFHYIVGSGSPADPDLIAEPTLVWQNLGPLSPGGSITVTFAVTATPAVTGTYVNVATATGTTPGGVLTDTDSAPVDVVNPAVAIEKRVAAVDLDVVEPNFVTFTILITNVGPSAIDVLPLQDLYDDYYLSFEDAAPYPDEDIDDGDLAWHDLTGPAPNGFGRDLLPGETFVITTVFRVVRDITTTVNTAIISGVLDVYDNPANRADDDAPVSDVPTAVGLLYFRVGEVTGRSVRLEWATAVEVDNFGFNLYRAPEPDRARASLLGLIPSQAHGSGATYGYTDTVPYDGTWWYWLADVNTAMEETFHGPVSATVGVVVLPYRVYLPIVVR
ncbi:MAG TPA: DUF11 domain-containing protein [Thermoflexia bacterium]|nr:DUF11 domain-containing protein [Thermoflexia bacterium]